MIMACAFTIRNWRGGLTEYVWRFNVIFLGIIMQYIINYKLYRLVLNYLFVNTIILLILFLVLTALIILYPLKFRPEFHLKLEDPTWKYLFIMMSFQNFIFWLICVRHSVLQNKVKHLLLLIFFNIAYLPIYYIKTLKNKHQQLLLENN